MTNRILHIIPGLDPGGAENILLQVVLALTPPEWEHHVLSLKTEGKLTGQLRAAGARVQALGMDSGRPTVAGLLALGRLAKALRPRIVQGWMYHGNLAAAAAVQTVWPPPLLYWSIHNATPYLPGYPLHTQLAARANALMCEQPEAVIYVAESSIRAHERAGYGYQHAVRIPGGVDTQVLTPNAEAAAVLRQRLGVAEDTHLVGILARYHPMKDHATFLRAAAALEDTRVHYVLAGTGLESAPEELKPLIPESLAPRLHWLGHQTNVVPIMQGLDVCTLSSKSDEALPMVLLEGMACGALCVATDVGDCYLLLEDVGWIVPPSAPARLARGWQDALHCGATERQSRSLQGRQRVLEGYSRVQLRRHYQQLYGGLPTHHGPAAAE